MNLSIARDGVEIGVWATEDVLLLYKQGHLLPTDIFWTDGMSEWQQLKTFIPQSLFEELPELSLPTEDAETLPQPSNINIVTQNVQTSTEEDRIIANGVEVVTTICHLFSKPIFTLKNDLSNENKPYSSGGCLDRFYVRFFESAEYLETLAIDHVSKIIISNTLRTDIRNKTFNSLAHEIKSDAFKRFIVAHQTLQNVLNDLHMQYHSVNATDGTVSGGLTGAGLGYLVSGRNSGVRAGAVAGALAGTALRAVEKAKLHLELQVHGILACLMLLEELPLLAESLFDQYIIYTLYQRPLNNPAYQDGLRRLTADISKDLVPNCVQILTDIKNNELGRRLVNVQKNSLGCVVTLVILFVLLGVAFVAFVCAGYMSETTH